MALVSPGCARVLRLAPGNAARLEQGASLHMIILGMVLLVVGFILAVHLIWILGIVALVVGLVLALLGATGRAIGGRRHYY